MSATRGTLLAHAVGLGGRGLLILTLAVAAGLFLGELAALLRGGIHG